MKLHFLELKIPPVLLVGICVAMMIIQSKFPILHLPASWMIANLIMTCGAIIIGLAVVQFRHAKTTVNPMNPNQSNQVINTGIFAVSRNPMYFGMALILAGLAIGIGDIFVWFWVFAFIFYITQFQIKPEERILTQKFGNEFIQYCQQVRRWI